SGYTSLNPSVTRTPAAKAKATAAEPYAFGWSLKDMVAFSGVGGSSRLRKRASHAHSAFPDIAMLRAVVH
ncbi:hypothetical protein E4U41_001135, partial [Claviceps citrina]